MIILINYPIAIPYKYNNDKYNEIAKEFNIIFLPRNKVEDLITFIEMYKDIRINIAFPEGISIDVCKKLQKKTDNFSIRLKVDDLPLIDFLRENKIKFFFDTTLPATNYTHLDFLIKIGVSDVYIADDLCYNLPDVSEYCHKYDVKVRLVLNRIPCTSPDKGINPCSPFYCPQDMRVLNKYYDIFEFDCGQETYDWHKFKVLYRAWFENHYWHGNLKEINPDIILNIDNDTYYKRLIDNKIVCGRRCNQRVSSPCRKCYQWLDISNLLQEKEWRFKDITQK